MDNANVEMEKKAKVMNETLKKQTQIKEKSKERGQKALKNVKDLKKSKDFEQQVDALKEKENQIGKLPM